jgi:hypothetical protein
MSRGCFSGRHNGPMWLFGPESGLAHRCITVSQRTPMRPCEKKIRSRSTVSKLLRQTADRSISLPCSDVEGDEVQSGSQAAGWPTRRHACDRSRSARYVQRESTSDATSHGRWCGSENSSLLHWWIARESLVIVFNEPSNRSCKFSVRGSRNGTYRASIVGMGSCCLLNGRGNARLYDLVLLYNWNNTHTREHAHKHT